MAARMRAFLQPQRKQQTPPDSKATPHQQPGRDRGLGDLHLSTSQRPEDASIRQKDTARAGVRGPSTSHDPSEEDQSEADKYSGGGQARAEVLADDGESTPRQRGIGSGAAGGPDGSLQSPGKRSRAAAAAQAQGVASPGSRAADARGCEKDAAVKVLDSPEKRRKARPPNRAAAPAGPPRGAGSSRGRGRGRPPADADAAPIVRLLQRQPAGSDAPSAGAAARSGACRGSGPAAGGTPRGGCSQPPAGGRDGVIDLSQSASPPQRGTPQSAAPATPRSSSNRCSTERKIEELLMSRGIDVRPRLSHRTPAARPVGRALSFATPSTGGDIVVDLATPLSQEPAEHS